MYLIYILISISKEYDINLENAWSKWNKKAISKTYY